MLGVCLFFWGLGYKMSLYGVHTTGIHRIPEAKLLSRDEDRNATQAVELRLTKTDLPQQSTLYAVFGLLALISVAGLRVERERHYISIPKLWCWQFGAFRSALFVRPPPVFLSAFIL